ncbi:hypothetical protein SUGI_1154630 [Cryptomeria japonica]|uniref:uncharacterized protein LOC131075305 isoform X2 n=1 Tax=Cryptomeria japonica TaxID=3369 RepID=UPI002414890C|nr:uncharacterized protein LOC131075305 isoform X2 [Cryptomeria japonica]GLJ53990.1 hypothetical protein SUGI_1154630 [Cryptomeria japonica]
MVMGRLMTPQEKSPLKEDEELWNRLNKRSRCLSDSSSNDENKKRKKEDMKLLDEGMQAVASSLTQLTNALTTATADAAVEEHEEMKMGEEALSLSLKEVISVAVSPSPSSKGNTRDHQHQVAKALASSPNPKKNAENLGDNLNVAKSLACKAKLLQRQMTSLKADLCFVRERCAFLEEENSRLRDRDRVGDGVRPEEDDLVRLQLEVLLAEKGRLAQENANLTRENEYLHQLVEYHQLTCQEDIIGMCSDFSSVSPPVKRIRENGGSSRLHLDANGVLE